MRKIIAIVLVLGLGLSQLLVLQHCANPIPPTGGARDSIGPQLVIEESTPQLQKNFKPQRIELTFDEWVKLKDPTQVIISPPLEPAPKISLKKRSLIIDFGEAQLRDSVTYVINVGEAVVDLTESNPPENLRFVFATGPILDSASVQGKLVDAYTEEAIENALLALYANPADTAALTENPFYFAKTDEEGAYEIFNIRPGSYQVVALDNGNFGGYKYNERSTARVGFLDTIVTIPDGASGLPPLRIFPLPKPLRLLKKDTSDFGEIKLAFDRPAEEVILQSQSTYQRVNDGDTMRLFYTEARVDTLLFTLDTVYTDTFRFRPLAASSPTATLQIAQTSNRNITPFDPYTLTFNRPLEQLDTTLVTLRKDTFSDPINYRYAFDSLYPRRLNFLRSWEENARYTLTVLPEAVTDVYDQGNPDTLNYTFSVIEEKKLGTLNLTLDSLDRTRAYVARLVKGSDRKLVRQLRIPPGERTFTTTLVGLEPAEFKLELIRDDNGNGRYDGGDFIRRTQPEPVTIYTLEKLRANWEVEAKIEVDY
ncbi:MAG: Ig-like domain-containing protein [Bacteroidota bacterium]